MKKSGNEKYYESIGRRKSAVARVRVSKGGKSDKENKITINQKDLGLYFPRLAHKNKVLSPFRVLTLGGYDVSVKVEGGGVAAQAEAIRLGISRALVKLSEEYKPKLKTYGYLTRDARVVERKKPGLRKARRAQQWRKR